LIIFHKNIKLIFVAHVVFHKKGHQIKVELKLNLAGVVAFRK
jgi:hypothetical protein